MIPRRAVVLGLAATVPTPAPAKPRFQTLFNGRSLEGWTRLGAANWTLSDGVVAADSGGIGFLVSEDSYRDFDARVEFWVSHDANPGIFIRCGDRESVSATSAYEVNIFDTRPDPSYGTGAIVYVAKVAPMPKAGGRWNVMEIGAHGDAFSVTLNGRRTVGSARDAAHAEGPIALQYAAGVVKFRKVQIRAWAPRPPRAAA
jgi:hypothetical protein